MYLMLAHLIANIISIMYIVHAFSDYDSWFVIYSAAQLINSLTYNSLHQLVQITNYAVYGKTYRSFIGINRNILDTV